jgi:hypothetical protein
MKHDKEQKTAEKESQIAIEKFQAIDVIDRSVNSFKSEFDSMSPLFEDDDKLEDVWNSYNSSPAHSLSQFIQPGKFKSYNDLKAKLHKVLALGAVAARDQTKDEAYTPAPVAKSAPAPKAESVTEDDDDCDIFLDDAVEDWDDDEDEDEEDLPYHRKYLLGSVQAFATGSGIFHYTVTKVGLKAYSHAYGNLFVVLGVDPYTFWRKNLPYAPVNYHEEVYGVIEGDAGYLDDAITALKALCKDHMEKYSLDCAKPTITPTSARASLAIPMDGLEVKELTVHNSIIL